MLTLLVEPRPHQEVLIPRIHVLRDRTRAIAKRSKLSSPPSGVGDTRTLDVRIDETSNRVTCTGSYSRSHRLSFNLDSKSALVCSTSLGYKAPRL